MNRQGLLVKPPEGGNGRVPLGVCCLLGKVVEAALRLAYRPAAGQLPTPLQCQAARDLLEVRLSDVLQEGRRQPSCVTVKVPQGLADLAIRIARDVVGKLQAAPFNLEVLAVDHTGSSSCPVAHDLLMCPRPAVATCLEQGLHSVEVKCREVLNRLAFPWEERLTDEALPLFSAELLRDARHLKSRILVFVSLPRPCTSGPFATHASIFHAGADDWVRLWGWAGFRASPQPPARASPKPKAAPAPRRSPPKSKAAPAPHLSLTTDQKWEMLLAKLHVEDGCWVRRGRLMQL